MASEQTETTAPSPGQGGLKLEYLHPIEPSSPARVEMLTDGIFAVAATILILDVKVAPISHAISAGQFSDAVIALWPKLTVFFCSFITLGRLWEMHRYIFHLLERCDQKLLFWNTLALAFACCLPFSTSVAGEYPHFSLAAAIYAVNMLALNLVYRGLWYHASHGDYLLKSDINPAIRKAVMRRFNVYFVLTTAALVLAYFSSVLSIALIVLHQLVMFFGQPLFKGQRV